MLVSWQPHKYLHHCHSSSQNHNLFFGKYFPNFIISKISSWFAFLYRLRFRFDGKLTVALLHNEKSHLARDSIIFYFRSDIDLFCLSDRDFYISIFWKYLILANFDSILAVSSFCYGLNYQKYSYLNVHLLTTVCVLLRTSIEAAP